MSPISRRTRRASLVALALAALGCAHAPPAAAPAAAKATGPSRVLLTGSRLPQAVDEERPLPNTVSPVKVYGRDRLLGSGRPTLGAALQSLDPSVASP